MKFKKLPITNKIAKQHSIHGSPVDDCCSLPGCSSHNLLTAPPDINSPFWPQQSGLKKDDKNKFSGNHLFPLNQVKNQLQLFNTIEEPSTSTCLESPGINGPTKIFDFLFLGSMDDALDTEILKVILNTFATDQLF